MLTTRHQGVQSNKFSLNLQVLGSVQVTVHKIGCASVGLLGVGDIAMGLGLVLGRWRDQ